MMENGVFNIPTITNGLKDYYISKKDYEDVFGVKDVISPIGEGTERFYIMALKDIDNKQNGRSYDWYNAAGDQSDRMQDYADTTSKDFETGKDNTNKMIKKWDEEAYGEKNLCESHKDIWEKIKEQVNNGWYLPSSGEWSAFIETFGISNDSSDEKYYKTLGLSNAYWTSSQYDAHFVLRVDWKYRYLLLTDPNVVSYVRLGATF